MAVGNLGRQVAALRHHWQFGFLMKRQVWKYPTFIIESKPQMYLIINHFKSEKVWNVNMFV